MLMVVFGSLIDQQMCCVFFFSFPFLITIVDVFTISGFRWSQTHGFMIPQLFDPRDQTSDYEQQLSFR